MDNSEMDFDDVQLSDLGHERCQGDSLRLIKEFNSRFNSSQDKIQEP